SFISITRLKQYKNLVPLSSNNQNALQTSLSHRMQPLALNGDCDKQIDVSKMHHSNQEYYLKLEELKNAHLETMAKLESMYRNKLCLKREQPLGKGSAAAGMCCRPTWEKSSYQPLHLHTSFSDSDLSDPLSSSVSEGSDGELAFEENRSETPSSALARHRIETMWDGFSVEDYIPRTKPSSPACRTTQKKQKAWSPKVTVPKPFQMTLREARKKEQNIKSKSLVEMENNLLKKQLEEEAECQKQFRANPVPAAVFLPLYHEILQRNEERRRSVKERSKLQLLACQKPFKFIEREKQRNEMRKMQLRDLSAPEKKTGLFKAKPVPRCVYSPAVNDRLKEEELYREIRIRMRAEELLRNSSLPNSRLALKDPRKKQTPKCSEPKQTEQKPRIKSSVPDFELLHQRFQQRLLQQKQAKHLTVCEPFGLRTPYIPSNKGKILKDIEEDEEKLKETRWPYVSPRRKPQMRRSRVNSHLGGSKSPKITESTRRRVHAIRSSLEEKRKLEEQQQRLRTKQKQRTQRLQKLVTTRAEANDPHQSLAQVSKSKLRKQRMQEYLQELQEMEERVKQRPLLFERVTQKNARIAAEKHFSNRLRALGICPEFVSRKGQTTKFLQSELSPPSDQHHEEEEEEEKEEGEEEKEAKANAGQSLGDSQEEEDDDQSRSSSQSDQPHEREEEVQSDPEAEGAFGYEDEEYENDDSEEKPSDDEAD
uniref:Protein FAM161A n=1 Tax=Amazona collaria TaxID=241587 RepID=A0A8B9IXP4_9PSIT